MLFSFEYIAIAVPVSSYTTAIPAEILSSTKDANKEPDTLSPEIMYRLVSK
jgi:hypothetical protein